MAFLRTANQLAEDGLRRIGAYAINMAAARPQDLDVALNALDKLVSELAGTNECFWLLTRTLSISLTADTASYDLRTALGADWPSQGIEYVSEAWIEDASGNRYPAEIVTRFKFDAVSDADTSGRPEIIHIDRVVPSPLLRPWPIPADTSWTLKLVIHTSSPTIWTQRPGGKTNAGAAVLSGLPSAWARWAEYALAADIGSGPVRKMPSAETNGWRVIAEQARERLLAFQNREHETTPPITASMDVIGGSDDWGYRGRSYTDEAW